MSDYKYLSKELPDMEKSFIISLTGEFTRTKFEGEFKCRIPNNETKTKVSKYRAMLNEGLDDHLDIGTRNYHQMIAYLKYTLVKFPDFWEETNSGMQLYDVNIVEEVYNKVLAFEEEWVSKVWPKPKKKK